MVLVLVAILAGLAVLAVRGRDTQAIVDTDAERLLALFTLAREEVLFRYRTLGVWFWQRGYRFLTYTEGAWQPSLDPLLASRELAAGVGLRLYLEGRPVVLEAQSPEAETQAAEGEEPLPQVVFFPDGAVTPFEIVVESPQASARTLRGTPTGQLTLDRDEPVD